jgi:hypothetical protein
MIDDHQMTSANPLKNGPGTNAPPLTCSYSNWFAFLTRSELKWAEISNLPHGLASELNPAAPKPFSGYTGGVATGAVGADVQMFKGSTVPWSALGTAALTPPLRCQFRTATFREPTFREQQLAGGVL